MKLQRNRQILYIIIFAIFLFSLQSCAQKSDSRAEQIKKEDYLKNVDYSIRTDIINPDTLKGDQKKIFYHPLFLKLSYEEAKNLEPLKVKEEFQKLDINTNQRARFVEAFSFFITYYRGHKKACENMAYFDFLKPKSKN